MVSVYLCYISLLLLDCTITTCLWSLIGQCFAPIWKGKTILERKCHGWEAYIMHVWNRHPSSVFSINFSKTEPCRKLELLEQTLHKQSNTWNENFVGSELWYSRKTRKTNTYFSCICFVSGRFNISFRPSFSNTSEVTAIKACMYGPCIRSKLLIR